jgi:hypothetical protein
MHLHLHAKIIPHEQVARKFMDKIAQSEVSLLILVGVGASARFWEAATE